MGKFMIYKFCLKVIAEKHINDLNPLKMPHKSYMLKYLGELERNNICHLIYLTYVPEWFSCINDIK